MSNLKILWPQVQLRSVAVQTWQAYSDERPVFNLWGKERGQLAERSAASTDAWFIEWDMGASSTVQVDTVYMGYMHLQQSLMSAMRVQSAASVSAIPPSVGTGTDLYNNASFASAVKIGVQRNRASAEDFIATWSLSAAARCIRFWLTPTSSQRLFFSKLFICEAFDFDREVEEYSPAMPQNNNARWESPDGQMYTTRTVPQKHRIELVWRGVTNAKVAAFAEIAKFSAVTSYALYNTTNTILLHGLQVLNVKLLSWESSRDSEISDYNTVTTIWEECV